MKTWPSKYANSEVCKPLLSVLVPTYCYAVGLERIMAGLTVFQSIELEIIIFDDSPNSDIEKIVNDYANNSISTILYRRNVPPLGAIDNWNALLDAARGDYCLLMHHDEFPIGDNFIKNLINELSSSNASDIFLLDCILVNPLNGLYRQHLPMWIRSYIINNNQNFLFRRNVIGPTSSLVIRRSLYPKFNNKLRWLVDVDLYYRIFKFNYKVKFCDYIKIGSIINRPDSITAMLGSEINVIKRKECSYLNDLYPGVSIWLNSKYNDSPIGVIIHMIESFIWISLRIIFGFLNVVSRFRDGKQ